jgi:hypothetical protein
MFLLHGSDQVIEIFSDSSGINMAGKQDMYFITPTSKYITSSRDVPV